MVRLLLRLRARPNLRQLAGDWDSDQGLGLRVEGLGLRVEGLGLRV